MSQYHSARRAELYSSVSRHAAQCSSPMQEISVLNVFNYGQISTLKPCSIDIGCAHFWTKTGGGQFCYTGEFAFHCSISSNVVNGRQLSAGNPPAAGFKSWSPAYSRAASIYPRLFSCISPQSGGTFSSGPRILDGLTIGLWE